MHLYNQETASIEQLKPVISEASLSASVMVEQPIIQAVISSTETFDGTKIKFESWKTLVENATQISGQNIIGITFSKIVGSPLTSACRLWDCLPYLTWDDVKYELLRLLQTLPFESHAMQAFAHL